MVPIIATIGAEVFIESTERNSAAVYKKGIKELINPEEKLNRIDKEHPGFIEIIRYLSNNINKVDKEFIYRSLGNRTTLEQYAEIEKISLNDLLDYLNISTGNLQELPEGRKNRVFNFSARSKKPEFLTNLTGEDLIDLDVRSDILLGIDPINKIKGAISLLTGKNAIRLINSFEPVPLFFALEKKGIKHWSEHMGDYWNIYFYL